jgi:hypothetical protein
MAQETKTKTKTQGKLHSLNMEPSYIRTFGTDGLEQRWHTHGELNRILITSGVKTIHEEHYVGGKPHCVDAPAYFDITDGVIITKYYIDGGLSRVGNPAVSIIGPNHSTMEYWLHGKRHKQRGPAVVIMKGGKMTFQAYYNHGKLHNLTGPAIITPNGSEFWINGEQVTEDRVRCVLPAPKVAVTPAKVAVTPAKVAVTPVVRPFAPRRTYDDFIGTYDSNPSSPVSFAESDDSVSDSLPSPIVFAMKKIDERARADSPEYTVTVQRAVKSIRPGVTHRASGVGRSPWIDPAYLPYRKRK